MQGETKFLTPRQREIQRNVEEFDRQLAIRKKTVKWKANNFWMRIKLAWMELVS